MEMGPNEILAACWWFESGLQVKESIRMPVYTDDVVKTPS